MDSLSVSEKTGLCLLSGEQKLDLRHGWFVSEDTVFITLGREHFLHVFRVSTMKDYAS